MGGFLLVSALHKQAFASATKHQLLAFLQVAAFANVTAVLPFARVGEPAFVGLPEAGYRELERYFDVDGLRKRWPCLRTTSYEAYAAERRREKVPLVALQLGLPPGRVADGRGFVPERCGRRSRALIAEQATFACVDLVTARSAVETLSSDALRSKAVIVTNWSQKVVGLGDAASPLFGDAFARRGGCHDASTGDDHRAFPALAPQWHRRADDFLKRIAGPGGDLDLGCVHVRAEKLASAATGPEKRTQWSPLDGRGGFRSTYMETCIDDIAAVTRKTFGRQHVLLITDTDPAHGTPSNQGSSHFKEWRDRGERLLRTKAFPNALAYCTAEARGDPECALVEAAACRRATHVLRFGSGTFSEFIVGDDPERPPSTQFLNCSHVAQAARTLPPLTTR